MRTLIRTPVARLPARDWCEAAPATGKGVDRPGRGTQSRPRPCRRDPSVPGADTHPELLPSGRAGESLPAVGARLSPPCGRRSGAEAPGWLYLPHKPVNQTVSTVSRQFGFLVAVAASVRPLRILLPPAPILAPTPRVCGQPGQIRPQSSGNLLNGCPARPPDPRREALRQRILRSRAARAARRNRLSRTRRRRAPEPRSAGRASAISRAARRVGRADFFPLATW